MSSLIGRKVESLNGGKSGEVVAVAFQVDGGYGEFWLLVRAEDNELYSYKASYIRVVE